eukprot:CAMPEP_0115246952 /NCGR_PEP_ID=MMETSP0270-20121206/41296_1 /TAXON_ID=71861 /ORGANISM="Scrippsiella trochoidea, Strain CCMP3099" /LENGTH=328 /DNA_ID=CAMNT_0002662191 /DNA_START=30 /DNA_END=1015 /DNA_ORIENTATION=-
MDAKMFECSVCLEVCRKCINCLQCNQILCKRHVKDLRDDRCPLCRDAPFRFQENVAMQRVIAELNRREGRLEEPSESEEEAGEVTNAPAPVVTNSARVTQPRAEERGVIIGGGRVTQGHHAAVGVAPRAEERDVIIGGGQMGHHAAVGIAPRAEERGVVIGGGRVTQEHRTILNAPWAGEPASPSAGAAAAAVAAGADPGEAAAPGAPDSTAPSPPVAPAASVMQRRWREAAAMRAVEAAEAHTSFGSKIGCRFREGDFIKMPNEQHAASMRAHIGSCDHEGCQHVWSGPWGSFIGGADGRTLFDLTVCAEGMRLNQMIGWNYDNPRC